MGRNDTVDAALKRDESGEAVDLVEVSGSIKWFDVAKGYGFILPDENVFGDILLHVTCLRKDGFQTALEGARVVWASATQGSWPAGVPRVVHGCIDGGSSG